MMKYMITTSIKSENVQKLADALAKATGNKCVIACHGDEEKGHMHIQIETKEPVRLEKIINEQAHDRYMRNHTVIVRSRHI